MGVRWRAHDLGLRGVLNSALAFLLPAHSSKPEYQPLVDMAAARTTDIVELEYDTNELPAITSTWHRPSVDKTELYHGEKKHDDDSSAPSDYPSDEQLATLRRVPDAIPFRAFLVAICELAERYSYYGVTAVLLNE